ALADTADALGSYAGPERAREIMRSGSVGPMGTATLVLVLLAQVAALGALVEAGAWLAPVAALVLSRCLPVSQLRRGVPAASETGFGALVAGSQSRTAVAVIGVISVAAGAALAGSGWGADRWWAPAAGATAGLAAYAAAAGFVGHAGRRFDGVDGGGAGATSEAATATALVAAVLLAGAPGRGRAVGAAFPARTSGERGHPAEGVLDGTALDAGEGLPQSHGDPARPAVADRVPA